MNVIDRWSNFKRLLLVIFSVLMWFMSIVFSYMGFKSGVRSEWYFGLFAIILSGTITTMELYLNSQTFDFSELEVGMIILWIGGIAAYIYGVWTNIVGVSIMMIGTGDMTTVSWEAQVVPIIVGILLEVLPEPMFVAFLKTKKISKPQDLTRSQQRSHFEPSQKSKEFPRSIPDEIRRQNPISTFKR